MWPQPTSECQLHQDSHVFPAVVWLVVRKMRHKAKKKIVFSPGRTHSKQIIQHDTGATQDSLRGFFFFIFFTVVFCHRQRGRNLLGRWVSHRYDNSLKGNGLWKRWWTIKKWSNSHLGHQCRASFFFFQGFVSPQMSGSAQTPSAQTSDSMKSCLFLFQKCCLTF